MTNNNVNGLSLANFWVGLVAITAGVVLGVYQVVERSGLFPVLDSPTLYFASVSTHGVLMGYVVTTFMIMGFGYYATTTSLKMPLPGKSFAWFGFWFSLLGVLIAAVPLLTGNGSVMYTFYPPLVAHPALYIGATMLVVGSWVWCFEMIWAMSIWKKAHPGEAVPLVHFGNTANAILWLFTTLGVAAEMLFQLIPWSLGLLETIDVGLARTFFSGTLHAIVYFWLFPAYIAMYTIVPKVIGSKLFSDEMARIAFIMLLVISVPIGMHHLYLDPFQEAGWKFVHMFGTFLVGLPTLFTGFTVIATLELAGRLRGGKGLFGWIMALPWKEPMMAALGCSMMMLTFGGFGGLVNASYSMDVMLHNTQWITGHFHLIFAGTTIIMYMGIVYHMFPRMLGRSLYSSTLAVKQLWLWFVGMLVLTLPWHYLGILGQPRRISSAPYDSPLVEQWIPHDIGMIVGGVLLLVSVLMLVYNLVKTHGSDAANLVMEYAEPIHPAPRVPALLNGFGFWSVVVVIYLITSYGYPIAQFFIYETFGATTWGV
ncbi:MAG: cytochrome C oxidase subunit I [Gammaproteobacteria bacterium]|jgi:cytochrome c oxidase subunit 1|nr:cytochrome C oxidase subunit I [Gammaproteobacteria bacterium]MBT3721956.1 cytochrome C oxidase subunit I [Gammaproteobacteria bacterium]MBT4075855.1 cytochrome C oxidase subunit I [Gammaproteobacteria bacterium]MBT4195231.1 cytochrome C oxidase subunit I [Gammaproteobacteria bacterium]MBT4451315.1 cytochrome C oxidase subunit I [Gammaproteobacteria bacterium]